jgi:hypothetical protein
LSKRPRCFTNCEDGKGIDHGGAPYV